MSTDLLVNCTVPTVFVVGEHGRVSSVEYLEVRIIIHTHARYIFIFLQESLKWLYLQYILLSTCLHFSLFGEEN